MALVETMLVDTSPFLVLDDPFTNLDNKKLVEAINLLKEISNEYQIIYMVCHNSRTIKKKNIRTESDISLYFIKL